MLVESVDSATSAVTSKKEGLCCEDLAAVVGILEVRLIFEFLLQNTRRFARSASIVSRQLTQTQLQLTRLRTHLPESMDVFRAIS